jgi:hypothetical protein
MTEKCEPNSNWWLFLMRITYKLLAVIILIPHMNQCRYISALGWKYFYFLILIRKFCNNSLTPVNRHIIGCVPSLKL